jgi:ATP-dependent Lhr-like helicase
VVFELLHPKLREAIEELGYTSPTPAQEAAIPKVLSGMHTLIIAPTGFGKTEAALFPVFSKMLEASGMG